MTLPQRPGTAQQSSRTAGAAALSGDGRHWVLLNVSPAVARQLSTDARLLRHPGLPDAAVRTVVLTDAQMDHVTGLLSLRDGVPIHLYATPAVFEELTHEIPVLPVLQHYCGVHWHVIPVAGECRTATFHVDGQPMLEFTAVATEGPTPRHVSRADAPVVGETIALAVRDLVSGQRFFRAGSLSGAGETALEWMREADCVLVGNDAQSAAPRAAGDGQAPSCELFDGARASRRLLMARVDGEQPPSSGQSQTSRWGCEIADDRMEIEL